MRHSASCRKLNWSELSAPIRDAITELSAICSARPVALEWNEDYIAVLIEVGVDLPTRGTVDGIDIRSVEPVILAFHKRQYPLRAPAVFSDRKDFPTDRLPHLNPTSPGSAASLCLHRGSIDEWFAEHNLREFVERIRSWMRDAARDRLIRSSDFFEPTRIADSTVILMFDPNDLDRRVRRHWTNSSGTPGHAYLHSRMHGKQRETAGLSTRAAIHISYIFTGLPDQEDVERVKTWNAFDAEARNYEAWQLGLAMWPAKREINRYFGHLPTNYAELRDFAGELGVDLRKIIDEFSRSGARCARFIPITMAVLRPRPLIGTASHIEWLSFLLFSKESEWPPEAEQPADDTYVLAMGHRRPLTPPFATELSGREGTSSTLARPVIVGCGAVGSRISLHLAKSGTTEQLLIDEATLTPHHLVRHGLHSGRLGKNKAEALKEEIVEIFGKSSQVAPEAHAGSVLDVLQDAEKLKSRSLIIDASASGAVLHALTRANLSTNVCRCEIADAGRLGILSYEGPGRNPRVDDLQVQLWGLALTESAVSTWLGRHRDEIEGMRGPVLEEIGVGIGCSSATMRLSDDIVAYHASQFALGVRRFASAKSRTHGHIRISEVVDDRALETHDISVKPVHLLRVRNEHEWSVRIAASAEAVIREEFRRAGGRETGGLLIGYIHRKRATAYVSHVLPPSPDSVGTPGGFKRGVLGYAEAVEQFERQTAGLLGYIGEWHTHPHGRAEPSRIDLDTLKQTHSVLGVVNMPALMMIMAPNGMKAYLYD